LIKAESGQIVLLMLRSYRSNKCHGVLPELEVDQVLLKRRQPAKQNELLNHAVSAKAAQKKPSVIWSMLKTL